MKKKRQIVILREGKDLKSQVLYETNPILSQEKMKQLSGGRDNDFESKQESQFCDAVCIPQEMGITTCPCQFSMLA